MVSGYKRGHPIQYVGGQWVYADNGTPIEQEERPCVRCGRMPTAEGYDACLGYLPGASSACCGHGVTAGYIVKKQTAAIERLPVREKAIS